MGTPSGGVSSRSWSGGPSADDATGHALTAAVRARRPRARRRETRRRLRRAGATSVRSSSASRFSPSAMASSRLRCRRGRWLGHPLDDGSIAAGASRVRGWRVRGAGSQATCPGAPHSPLARAAHIRARLGWRREGMSSKTQNLTMLTTTDASWPRRNSACETAASTAARSRMGTWSARAGMSMIHPEGHATASTSSRLIEGSATAITLPVLTRRPHVSSRRHLPALIAGLDTQGGACPNHPVETLRAGDHRN